MVSNRNVSAVLLRSSLVPSGLSPKRGCGRVGLGHARIAPSTFALPSTWSRVVIHLCFLEKFRSTYVPGTILWSSLLLLLLCLPSYNVPRELQHWSLINIPRNKKKKQKDYNNCPMEADKAPVLHCLQFSFCWSNLYRNSHLEPPLPLFFFNVWYSVLPQ